MGLLHPKRIQKVNQVEKKYITKGAKETQKLGERLARETLALRPAQGKNDSAVIFALRGDLGGGKTTFLQGFAKGLGIKEKILSPTFIIYRKFKIPLNSAELQRAKSSGSNSKFTNFYHIDCYRINKPQEILELGWKKIISNPKNIVAIEWPEKIKKYLPKNSIKIKFKFIDKNKREINFKS